MRILKSSQQVCICAILLILVPLGLTASFAAPPPLRLGWQTTWATQAQLVMGLKYTNIPQLVGVRLEYPGFSYGAPLNQAALAGKVDILLTADQPALVLMAHSPGFRIVARMMYNRVCLYVPPLSPVEHLTDLAGGRVSGPVGAAAQRKALESLKNAGVDISHLVTGNLDMAPQAALLNRAGASAKTWPGVDALYGFDPWPALFEEEHEARMLSCAKVISLVLASREMIEQRPHELADFLTGFALSWRFFARDRELANAWFSADSNLKLSNKVLDQSAEIEPNWYARSIANVRLSLTDQDLGIIRDAQTFLLEQGIVSQASNVASLIDTTALDQSQRRPDLASLDRQVRPNPSAPRVNTR